LGIPRVLLASKRARVYEEKLSSDQVFSKKWLPLFETLKIEGRYCPCTCGFRMVFNKFGTNVQVNVIAKYKSKRIKFLSEIEIINQRNREVCTYTNCNWHSPM